MCLLYPNSARSGTIGIGNSQRPRTSPPGTSVGSFHTNCPVPLRQQMHPGPPGCSRRRCICCRRGTRCNSQRPPVSIVHSHISGDSLLCIQSPADRHHTEWHPAVSNTLRGIRLDQGQCSHTSSLQSRSCKWWHQSLSKSQLGICNSKTISAGEVV